MLREATANGNISELRTAIEKAEQYGIDSLPARQQYSELAKQERQSPGSIHDMLVWGMSTQDGVILYNVIQEAMEVCPGHQDLPAARAKLAECHEEARARLQRVMRNRDARSLATALERARRMGIPPDDLVLAERSLWALGEAQQDHYAAVARASRGAGGTSPRLTTTTTASPS